MHHDFAALESFGFQVSGAMSAGLKIHSSSAEDVINTFAGFKSPTTMFFTCKYDSALVMFKKHVNLTSSRKSSFSLLISPSKECISFPCTTLRQYSCKIVFSSIKTPKDFTLFECLNLTSSLASFKNFFSLKSAFSVAFHFLIATFSWVLQMQCPL